MILNAHIEMFPKINVETHACKPITQKVEVWEDCQKLETDLGCVIPGQSGKQSETL